MHTEYWNNSHCVGCAFANGFHRVNRGNERLVSGERCCVSALIKLKFFKTQKTALFSKKVAFREWQVCEKMASEKVDFEYPQKVFQKHIFLQNDKIYLIFDKFLLTNDKNNAITM